MSVRLKSGEPKALGSRGKKNNNKKELLQGRNNECLNQAATKDGEENKENKHSRPRVVRISH